MFIKNQALHLEDYVCDLAWLWQQPNELSMVTSLLMRVCLSAWTACGKHSGVFVKYGPMEIGLVAWVEEPENYWILTVVMHWNHMESFKNILILGPTSTDSDFGGLAWCLVIGILSLPWVEFNV